MTESRGDTGTEVPQVKALRSNRAVAFLRPAATALGMNMDDQVLRVLARSGELQSFQTSARGWRSYSMESLLAYREKLEQAFRDQTGGDAQ